MSIKLDMIGLTVANMAESVRFYSLLGLEFPEIDGPHIEAIGPGGLRIALDDLQMIKEIDAGWEEPTGQRIGLAFLCESPSAVDEMYTEIVAAGFEGYKEPWDAFWGQRYAQVTDPDGNHVDLFAWIR
jgi:uncharacterized glyoxalase superfamily protein PhnB